MIDISGKNPFQAGIILFPILPTALDAVF